MDQSANRSCQPGLITLFGSGETSPKGGQVFEWLAHRLTIPLRIGVLETPAGFELNSPLVAGRVADFLRKRLQNYQPTITVIPARKKGTPFSPDNPEIVRSLLDVEMIFLGPGSPTYAVRQLRDSLAWAALQARHRMGGTVVMASAATIASGALALPVYEIYKVGEDLHWKEGLNFFAPYGLSLVFVPHWNNAEGGQELDTRYCFMGEPRFELLLAMLPATMTVVGLDEQTALILDPQQRICRVMGRGRVHLIQGGKEREFPHGSNFSIQELGPFRQPMPENGIPSVVWQQALAHAQMDENQPTPRIIPDQVLAYVKERQQARERKDWSLADKLREEIEALGWRVVDTPEGPRIKPYT
jgi:hypothetical protein